MSKCGRRRSPSGELRADVLGPADAVVMAVARSAPAYSLAATTAVLVGLAGSESAVLLWRSLPMGP